MLELCFSKTNNSTSISGPQTSCTTYILHCLPLTTQLSAPDGQSLVCLQTTNMPSLQDHKSTFLLSLPICQSRAVFHRRLTPLLLWPLLSYMMCQTMGTLQQMHHVLKWKKCQWEINLRRRCTSSVNPQSTRNTVASYASHAYQRCGTKQFCGFDSLGEMHSAGIKLLCTPDQTYCVVHNKDQWSRVI